MIPIRHPQLESTWDQGTETFRLSLGGERFALESAFTRVWPLIDGKRNVEQISAELQDEMESGDVSTVLDELFRAKFIRHLQENYQDRVRNIFELNCRTSQNLSPSLLTGRGGRALFFLSEALRLDDEQILCKGKVELEHALRDIGQLSAATSFHEGPLGLLWLENLWSDKTGEKLLHRKTVAPFLRNYLRHHQKLPAGRFDFLYGTSGWALASQCVDRKILREMSPVMVNQIVASLVPNAFGAGLRGVKELRDFFSSDARLSDETYPGLAHGLSGALTALIVLRMNGALTQKYSDLISGFTETLLSFDHHHPMPRTFERPEFYDRQDWCHGDGGIGLTFLLLSKLTGSSEHRRHGLKLVKRAMGARTEKNNHGLCHGIGGKLAMGIVSRYLSSSESLPLATGGHRLLSSLVEDVNARLASPDVPLIVSSAGAAIALNAIDHPELLNFYYPLTAIDSDFDRF